jgi:predicted small metal-binding protein
MAKVLRCRDLGMNCAKEVRAETEEELLKLATEHAENDHGMSAANLPPSILASARFMIRDEPRLAKACCKTLGLTPGIC